MSTTKKLLEQAAKRQFISQGTGSIFMDAGKFLTRKGLSGTKRLINAAKGSPKKGSDISRATKKQIDDTAWKYYGKPISDVDRLAGKAASKIPFVGRAFKKTVRDPNAVTSGIRNKIEKGQKLSKAEMKSVDMATKGMETTSLANPAKKVGKTVVPVAAGIYLSEQARKKVGEQEKTAMVKVPKELLLKTAGLIRTLRQDKDEAKEEVEELRKLASAQKKVLDLLKEDLIDEFEIEEKVAELTENPEKADSLFFTTASDFGELDQDQTSQPQNILEAYLLGDK